uniref:Uncharacterized protein n=1 Tax=Arundo donax TaxID=35708 RepID=A0A0A9G5T1_ARUDO
MISLKIFSVHVQKHTDINTYLLNNDHVLILVYSSLSSELIHVLNFFLVTKENNLSLRKDKLDHFNSSYICNFCFTIRQKD